MKCRKIHIIGGGVSGLALGIKLQQIGVDSLISEAGTYPRHRVCGEFLSGKGIQLLHLLGLYDPFMTEGAVLAHTIKCYTSESESPILPLNEPALCLSRYSMDKIMASRYRALGGELKLKQRCPMRLHTRETGTVFATGRLPNLKRETALLGYKWHVENLTLEADLEMHFTPLGYVGLCRVEHNKVNICGLTKVKGTSMNIKKEWRHFLNQNLHHRRREAVMNSEIVPTSVCFTSGLSYPITTPRIGDGAIQIGDLGACIPPLTGNGMSMAMESAMMSAQILKSYHEGSTNWQNAVFTIQRQSQKHFRRRLICANPMHHLLMSSRLHGLRRWLVEHLPYYHQPLFSLTR
jgi:flavin-dependent dehydrogenase